MVYFTLSEQLLAGRGPLAKLPTKAGPLQHGFNLGRAHHEFFATIGESFPCGLHPLDDYRQVRTLVISNFCVVKFTLVTASIMASSTLLCTVLGTNSKCSQQVPSPWIACVFCMQDCSVVAQAFEEDPHRLFWAADTEERQACAMTVRDVRYAVDMMWSMAASSISQRFTSREPGPVLSMGLCRGRLPVCVSPACICWHP